MTKLATPLRAEPYAKLAGSNLANLVEADGRIIGLMRAEDAALIVGIVNESGHKDRALKLGLELCKHGLPLGPLEEMFVAHAKAALAAGGEKV